jgi:hypothetical protein
MNGSRIAGKIVLGSSGILMFLVGAALAWVAGFGSAIPARILPQASRSLIAYGLCMLLALHYVLISSQIDFFSKTSLAYALAIVGAASAVSKR